MSQAHSAPVFGRLNITVLHDLCLTRPYVGQLQMHIRDALSRIVIVLYARAH